MNECSGDIIINRLVSGEARDHDWREFAALAQSDPSLWNRIADVQRDQSRLAEAVRQAVACADAVELPGSAPRATGGRLWSQAAAWSGWAVAASLAIAVTLFLQSTPSIPVPQGGGVAPVELTLDDALRAYKDLGSRSGQVIGELPDKVLIDTRPASSGEGYELLYLRQFLERVHVPDLYEFAALDEQGRPTLVRHQQRPSGSF
jgi:hypothetical protein